MGVCRSSRSRTENEEAKKNYQQIKAGNIPRYSFEYAKLTGEKYPIKSPIRYKILTGQLEHKEKGVLTGEISKRYDKSRFKFFLDADFELSSKCCGVMKKSPAHAYSRKSGKYPIIATLAEESMLRTSKWLKVGCNAFEAKEPQSNPLSFWTEQDILHYIKANNIKLASVYGDIIIDHEKEGTAPGQLSLIPDEERPLKTSGVNRTGCMFCGFGCHLEKPGEGRFERMKTTHPKQYDYIMRPKEQGGLNYREIIDWINENGNLNIRY